MILQWTGVGDSCILPEKKYFVIKISRKERSSADSSIDMVYSYAYKKLPVCSALMLCAVFTVFSQGSFSSIAGLSGTGSPMPQGVYQDGSRIIAFSGEKEGYIILKTYYGWYYDAYHAVEKYPLEVPPLEIGGGLYTKYWIKSDTVTNPGAVFWRPCTNSTGIPIIPPLKDDEISGYLVSDNDIYRIRYWKVSVLFSSEKALIHAADENGNPVQYEVDKYAVVGSDVYTCAAGRGTIVRNPEKLSEVHGALTEFSDVRVSEDGMYAVNGEPEYTLFTEGDLDQTVETQNSRRKPPGKPLLEYMDLNFYYDEIERLRR